MQVRRALLVTTVLVVAALHFTVVHAAQCTGDEEDQSEKLWKEAATSGACELYSTKDGDSYSIVWPCDDILCTQVMRALADDLPQCVKKGAAISEKNAVAANVVKCDASGERETSPLYCSKPQMVSMGDNFLQVVTSESFVPYYLPAVGNGFVRSDFNRISVEAPCNSSCMTQITEFVKTLSFCRQQEEWKREINGSVSDCERQVTANLSVSFNFGDYIQESKYYRKDAPKNSPATSLTLGCGWLYVSTAVAIAVVLG